MVNAESRSKNAEKQIVEVKIAMAEFQKDIKYIKDDLAEIKDNLKTFIDCAPNNFISKENFVTVKDDIKELQKTVNDLKTKWAYATGVVVVLMFIIQAALKHFGVL